MGVMKRLTQYVSRPGSAQKTTMRKKRTVSKRPILTIEVESDKEKVMMVILV